MSASKTKRIEYYKAAASFWREAIRCQKQRCLVDEANSFMIRLDLNFYVVSVQRLREVGEQATNKLRLSSLRTALTTFDTRWPRFRELRNHEEHVKGPSGTPPLGMWYFQGSVADLQPNGKVEYVADVEDMEASVDTLFDAIIAALESA